MEWIKIILSDIPFYPSGFSDEKLVTGRIIPDEKFYEREVETEQEFRHIDLKGIKSVQKVQKRVYQKYSIEAFSKESVDLSTLKLSRKITIFFIENDKEVTWNIEVIGVPTRSEIEGTYNYSYNIEFYRLDSDAISIVNYLTTDYVEDNYKARGGYEQYFLNINSSKNFYSEKLTVSQNTLSISNNIETSSLAVGDSVTIYDILGTQIEYPKTGSVTSKNDSQITITFTGQVDESEAFDFTFYWEKTNAFDEDYKTALIPTFGIEKISNDSIENNNFSYSTSQTTYKTIDFVLFADDETKDRIVKYFDMADLSFSYNGITYYNNDGYFKEIEVTSDGLIDIHKITIRSYRRNHYR